MKLPTLSSTPSQFIASYEKQQHLSNELKTYTNKRQIRHENHPLDVWDTGILPFVINNGFKMVTAAFNSY